MADSATPAARILIVDDHPVMRKGLAQIIGTCPEFFVCGEAASMAEAIERLDETKPDLVTVDISLGDSSGIDLVKRIKESHPQVRTLVMSMHDEGLFAERSLRAGAFGYINKAEKPETFVQALRRVLSGEIYLSPQMTSRVLNRVASGAVADEIAASPAVQLSDRELEVFEMIGRGLTTSQIATRLNLSPKTVETYREHIKSKLDLSNATELIQHAVRWVLENS